MRHITRNSNVITFGWTHEKVDYKISTDGNEYISQADDKGRSKRIHTSKEENLKLDLNWISFEADSADNNGDAKWVEVLIGTVIPILRKIAVKPFNVIA